MSNWATSGWLLRDAKWSAVYPSAFFSSTIQGRGSLLSNSLVALQKYLQFLFYFTNNEPFLVFKNGSAEINGLCLLVFLLNFWLGRQKEMVLNYYTLNPLHIKYLNIFNNQNVKSCSSMGKFS